MDIEAMFGPLKADNDNLRVCLFCGGAVNGDARKIFCSASCRHQSRYLTEPKAEINCPVCEVVFLPVRRQKFCSPECRKSDEKRRRYPSAEREKALRRAPDIICEMCGVSFKGVAKDGVPRRFCSRACGARNTKDANTVKGLITKALRYGHGTKPVSYVVFRPLCDCCGVRFSAASALSRLCSDSCRAVDARNKSLMYNVANDNVDRSPRPCAECALVFSPAYGEKRTKFCSVACGTKHNGRIGKKKREAKMRQVACEAVDPIAVFERDKWACQECGIKTPRRLRGMMVPNAPELDHIMPISLGGAHSYMNTQCLCRKCNGIKSDSPPSQPSLFAYAA